MSELEAMGISVQRELVAGEADNVGGMTVLAFTLPAPSDVQATFSKEGVTKKLVKLFARELQTGDAAFDRIVYIKTDTLDATRALLESSKIRTVVARIIESGGLIEIDGPFVKMELAGRHETDDADTVSFVRGLIRAPVR
jgi:hypothetical protein